MSNKIEVGKTYKLVDASKDWMLEQAINEGIITFPDDGIVTIHSIEKGHATGETMGCSHTAGMRGVSNSTAAVEGDIFAVQQTGVDNGAFIEVS